MMGLMRSVASSIEQTGGCGDPRVRDEHGRSEAEHCSRRQLQEVGGWADSGSVGTQRPDAILLSGQKRVLLHFACLIPPTFQRGERREEPPLPAVAKRVAAILGCVLSTAHLTNKKCQF